VRQNRSGTPRWVGPKRAVETLYARLAELLVAFSPRPLEGPPGGSRPRPGGEPAVVHRAGGWLAGRDFVIATPDLLSLRDDAPGVRIPETRAAVHTAGRASGWAHAPI